VHTTWVADQDVQIIDAIWLNGLPCIWYFWDYLHGRFAARIMHTGLRSRFLAIAYTRP